MVRCRAHGATGPGVGYRMGRGIAQEDIPGLAEGLKEGATRLGGDLDPAPPRLGGLWPREYRRD